MVSIPVLYACQHDNAGGLLSRSVTVRQNECHDFWHRHHLPDFNVCFIHYAKRTSGMCALN